MSGAPLITIVIPSFNKEKFIGLTLESIFSQRYPNLQVIVKDGGSTDGTIKILHQYARRFPKQIVLISKKDHGQLDAINSGLCGASGDIVTFINADDCYLPGSFQKVAGFFKAHPDRLWVGGFGNVINDQGGEIAKAVTLYKNLLLRLNNFSLLLITNYFMQPAVFLRGSVFNKFGPFTGIRGTVMEYELWLKIASKAGMPGVIPDYLASFRLSSDSKSAKMSKSLLDEDLKISQKYTSNIFILGLHRLHNLLRIAYINIFSV